MCLVSLRLVMNNRHGFTLVEMLITLSIISTITFLAIPPLFSTYQKWELTNFLNVLEADVLYIQNNSLFDGKYMHILFMEDHYRLYASDNREDMIIRTYPANFRSKYIINERISFSDTGTVMNPNTLKFSWQDTTIKLIFPFGKGRHYVQGN